MNKKIIALTLSILVITITAAGCLGGDDDDDTGASTEPKLESARGSLETVSGWAERQSGDVANVDIAMNIPHSMVTKVSFRIVVEDSDAEHSETDEGSDPDEITVSVTWGNETEEPPMMKTPANFNIEITAPQGEYIPSTGTVSIHGDLKGGKPAYVFGLIVYVDQGFAYTVETEYTYMSEGE